MFVNVFYITNIGNFRDTNEDSLLVVDTVLSETSMNRIEHKTYELKERLTFAVADGMGGMPCGEVASRKVLESIKDKDMSSEEKIIKALKEAKKELDEYAEEKPECFGMGTAVAGLVLLKDKAFAFNVGDCRVYRLRGNHFERLTEDHTEVFQLFKRGLISEEEIRTHPYRSVLTSAIMGGYEEEFEIFVRELDLKKGDRFLVCSDGLWDEVSSMYIEECLSMNDLEHGAYSLLQKALKRGSDNITFIIVAC